MFYLNSILAFLHVLGAVGSFTAAGVEAVAIRRFRQARTLWEVRMWMRLLAVTLDTGSVVSLLPVPGRMAKPYDVETSCESNDSARRPSDTAHMAANEISGIGRERKVL